MRPHLAYIQNTLIKKHLAEKAADQSTSYRKYMSNVEKARKLGFHDSEIIKELESEAERIRKDIRAGDSLFLQGVANAQKACIDSIALIISELKGEN